MIQAMIRSWQKDRIYAAMVWCWYATVVTSFMGSTVISLSVPAVGELFPFRVFLPITVLLYVMWAIRTREFVWGELSFLEKVTYLLAVIMVVYGVASLPRAIEMGHTFSKLFNLCLDMAFFLLFLRLCRYQDIRRTTIRICLVMLAVLLALGTYEVFFGGIWNPRYDDFQRFWFFDKLFQFPVVFSYNTNDYVSTISFLFAILLLWKLNPARKWDRKDVWSIILAGVFSYFVVLASSGRLTMAGFLCSLVGGLLCLWIGKRRGRALITLLLLVGLLGIEFSNRYYYLMPQVEAYIEAVTTKPAPVPPSSGSTSAPVSEPEPVSPPVIDVTRPNSETVAEEIFKTDEETGEAVLREDSSGGIRLRLLIHAGECFLDSYGLGVGLGNTEVLTVEGGEPGETTIASIHCFIARLIADYGIFILIPLILICLSLLKSVFTLIWIGIQKSDRRVIGYGVLFLSLLMAYPFVSTASSDAQDIITMWIYLGVIILFAPGTDAWEERLETEEN